MGRGSSRDDAISTMPPKELTISVTSALPNGYKFIRAGNVSITRHCRKLTHEAGRTVYVVHDAKKRACGIQVPTKIWREVDRLNIETRDQRRETVKKKDAALEDKVRIELLKRFPKTPQDHVQQIVSHMLIKRSGRVGRSTNITISEMVDLGIRAHVRHKWTDYDALLAQGLDREKAREQVRDDIDKVLKAWRAPHAVLEPVKGQKKSLKTEGLASTGKVRKGQPFGRLSTIRSKSKRAGKHKIHKRPKN